MCQSSHPSGPRPGICCLGVGGFLWWERNLPSAALAGRADLRPSASPARHGVSARARPFGARVQEVFWGVRAEEEQLLGWDGLQAPSWDS